VVLPILKENNIPATVFINTAFINNKDIFYRYKASLLIESYNSSFQSELSEYFNEEIEQGNFSNEVLNINYQNKGILDEIASLMKINFDDYLVNSQPYLSHDQINELLANNITIGAHSVDHPDFHTINLNDQIQQVVNSLNYLVQTFKINYKAFSFPFTDHNLPKELYEVMKNLDIQLTFGTSGIKDDIIDTSIQRIPIENSDHSAQKIIFKEYFYYIIKRLVGKHILKRE
jgi:peptidoglycan/xylan/chitin deacetylase (PgdA/CDA1 family)